MLIALAMNVWLSVHSAAILSIMLQMSSGRHGAELLWEVPYKSEMLARVVWDSIIIYEGRNSTYHAVRREKPNLTRSYAAGCCRVSCCNCPNVQKIRITWRQCKVAVRARMVDRRDEKSEQLESFHVWWVSNILNCLQTSSSRRATLLMLQTLHVGLCAQFMVGTAKWVKMQFGTQ